MIKNIPNILSALRIPLAMLLLIDNLAIRSVTIIAAMLSDFFDGYLSRKYQLSSRLGTLLDPIADKFFILFAALVFIFQGSLDVWQLIAIEARDLSIAVFGIYLWLSKQWSSFTFHSIWCGKIVTTLQFCTFLLLCFNWPIPTPVWGGLILLGILSFFELLLFSKNPLESEL